MIFRAADGLPTLLVGDFNDWRNTLTDAALAADGFVDVTSPAGRFRTFPARMAMGPLDRAFVPGGVRVRHARVVRTSLSRAASDHLPLVVDFHVR